MFEQTDFFQDEIDAGPGAAGTVVGNIGGWGLHLAKVTFLIYSGSHGISAAIGYAGDSELSILAQIVGVVVVETVLLSLYLAWHNGKITGTAQMIAAGATYLIGFVLACLGIVADSQLHAGLSPSPWLVSYLQWGLPIAPAVMALGALLTHELAPHQLRQRRQSSEKLKFEDDRFSAHIASMRADLMAAKQITNANLNAKMSAAKQIAAHYSSDEVQAAIRQTAIGNVPSLLRAIGVDPSLIPDANGNGRIDTGEVADYLANNPDAAARLFGLARELDQQAENGRSDDATTTSGGSWLDEMSEHIWTAETGENPERPIVTRQPSTNGHQSHGRGA